MGAPVSSTNKIDRHDITEILLKVSLNTIKQTKQNKQDNDKRIHRLKSGLHGKINRIQQIISYFSILSNILNILGSFVDNSIKSARNPQIVGAFLCKDGHNTIYVQDPYCSVS